MLCCGRTAGGEVEIAERGAGEREGSIAARCAFDNVDGTALGIGKRAGSETAWWHANTAGAGIASQIPASGRRFGYVVLRLGRQAAKHLGRATAYSRQIKVVQRTASKVERTITTEGFLFHHEGVLGQAEKYADDNLPRCEVDIAGVVAVAANRIGHGGSPVSQSGFSDAIKASRQSAEGLHGFAIYCGQVKRARRCKVSTSGKVKCAIATDGTFDNDDGVLFAVLESTGHARARRDIDRTGIVAVVAGGGSDGPARGRRIFADVVAARRQIIVGDLRRAVRGGKGEAIGNQCITAEIEGIVPAQRFLDYRQAALFLVGERAGHALRFVQRDRDARQGDRWCAARSIAGAGDAFQMPAGGRLFGQKIGAGRQRSNGLAGADTIVVVRRGIVQGEALLYDAGTAQNEIEVRTVLGRSLLDDGDGTGRLLALQRTDVYRRAVDARIAPQIDGQWAARAWIDGEQTVSGINQRAAWYRITIGIAGWKLREITGISVE